MKTSVYIPVTSNNIFNLIKIIDFYQEGYMVPDEIVINAVGINTDSALETLRTIQNKKYTNVIIYITKTNLSEANNLNYSLKLTSGDIILYHNPLSLPSIRKVDIVHNYFDTSDIMILTHSSFNFDILMDTSINTTTLKVIPSYELYKRYFPFKILDHVWDYTHTYGMELNARGIDHKSICVRREVLKDIKWRNEHEFKLYKGQDVSYGIYYDFLLESLYKYNRSDIILVPLSVSNSLS